ncbi:MAG: sensor histidine kinase [Alphaproteobacteria bacterium]|nr:sensor histidine kinase [Alphaproteobacteria bacterium]
MLQRVYSRAQAAWQHVDMLRQFLFIASTVFVLGMALVGGVLAQRIEKGVVDNTAAATALYFESFVAPLVQELATSESLSASKRAQLEELIKNTALTKRVLAFKVWLKGAKIAYATDARIIGRTFSPSPNMRRAWLGQVAASLDHEPHGNEHHVDLGNVPVIEVYSPIRQEHTDRIIAVAEFYEDASELKQDIFLAQMESWAMIAGLAAVAIAALYGIVARGATTISEQRSALQQRIVQLSALLSQNDELRRQVQHSSRKATIINENYLRRFGAELHDGPAQLLGLALLRLDALRKSDDGQARGSECGEIKAIREALQEALGEIRNLSAGLSLPELEPLTLAATINSAVRAHRQRTGTPVDLELGYGLPETVPHAIKGTAYRLVQEGLNNATRHAGGQGQKVRADIIDDLLVIEVSDKGPGFMIDAVINQGQLGLVGLKERIQILHGQLEVKSSVMSGTRLTARIPIEHEVEEFGYV